MKMKKLKGSELITVLVVLLIVVVTAALIYASVGISRGAQMFSMSFLLPTMGVLFILFVVVGIVVGKIKGKPISKLFSITESRDTEDSSSHKR